jgi:hypothetical protein
MMRTFVQLAVVCGIALFVTSAHAYSDPTTFSMGVAEGGGGGRWFTGSPADGYTCRVCHGGGARTQLTISGLPIAGYVRGASYEVIVDWPDTVIHVGMAVEITDESGRSAGTIQLPEGATLDDREKCEPYGANIPAGFMNKPTPDRSVVNVADCGARRMRFLWIAPPELRGQLWLSGALVSADGSHDVHGDGVTDFARPITDVGDQAIASRVGGCSVVAARVGVGSIAWIALGIALLLGRGRRVVRRASR